MNISELKRIFENLSGLENWSLLLLKAEHKQNKSLYKSRKILFNPENIIDDFVNDLFSFYIENGKGKLINFTDIEPYDGANLSSSIYFLKSDNEVIKDPLRNLLKGVSDPNVESDISLYKTAYMLSNEAQIDGQKIPVKIITIKNPIKAFKYSYSVSCKRDGTFTKVNDNVVSLSSRIDCLFLGDTIFFFNLFPESFFNMERTFRKICNEKVEKIVARGIVSNSATFKKCATSSHNPRKFVSFSEEYFNLLDALDFRKKISDRFGIPLVGEKQLFDSSKEVFVNNLIKVLCKKAAFEPFHDLPVETPSIKPWNRG